MKIDFEAQYLTPEEARIWEEIKGRSRREAIRVRDLAERLKIDERRMRQVINRLRLMGYRIGSSSNPPPGYFHIKTIEDLDETCRMFQNRALDELYICSRIKKCSLPDIMRQMKLELEKDARQ